MFCRSLLPVLLGLSCLLSFTMAESANGAGLCCFEFHKRPLPTANVVSVEETRFDCTLPGVMNSLWERFRIAHALNHMCNLSHERPVLQFLRFTNRPRRGFRDGLVPFLKPHLPGPSPVRRLHKHVFQRILSPCDESMQLRISSSWPADERKVCPSIKCFLLPAPRWGLPFFSDLHTEVSRSWAKPFLARAFSPKTAFYSNVMGLREHSYGAMPRFYYNKGIQDGMEWEQQVIKVKSFTTAQSANGAGLCCFEFHKRPIPSMNIAAVQETRFDCTLPGVILTTRKGHRICADPEVDWVTEVMKTIFYSVVCWGSSISTADRKGLDKLIRKASSVLGIFLDTVQEVGERRMVTKLSSLLQNASHPLYETVTSLSSSFSDRLLHPKCLKERYRRSLLPAAIRLYNQSCSQ
ncbi:C-C motif chemokine 3-like [Silurus meridionalis]|nr:C-C motif chemokine 3-like [Silurus meridionalis]